jgi:hypothetical protein
MKAIDFIVRSSAGGLQRGTVSADATNQIIVAGSGQEISLNARQSDFASQVRSGDQLVITLSDGRMITIDNFFNDSGAANRFFVSADGYLNEVSFVDAGQGNLYAQYGPTAEWGKWSPSDELIFLGNNGIAGVPLAGGDENVSMLGGALLGGGGLLGSGALIAAGLGGAAIIGGLVGGGGGGGGDTGPKAPYVDDGDKNVVIGGDGEDKTLTITGGGEPGDEVKVIVGDKVVDTVIDDDGKFEAVFEGEDFPKDGVYDSEVVVTNPNGDDTDLDGPSFEIDTTPPTLTFTEGTESTGDFFNSVTFGDGVTLTGTGEAGATVAITIGGVTRSEVVSENGSWSLKWETGTLVAGEYTTPIKAVTTDSYGNSKTYDDVLVVDTVNVVTIDQTISTTVNGVTIVGDGVINGVEHSSGAIFTGTAQAGSVVMVTIGTVTNPATVSASGTWSVKFTSTELASGEYDGSVKVVSTDNHGNIKEATGTFEVDTFVRNLAITSTTGGEDGVINSVEAGKAMTVSGTTEPGSTVVVELGGKFADVVVSGNGNWTATFKAGSITAGTYTATMTATATDAAGNVDMAETPVKVDTEAGKLTIDSTPVEGDDIVNKVEASDGVVLTGTADPYAMVTVTMNGVSHTVETKGNGTWEAKFMSYEVAPGVYTADITASITDEYGNTLSASDSVEVDTRVDNLTIAADDIATDNIISAIEHDGMVTVTGTTEAGSTLVMVKLGTQELPATINAAGSWKVVFDASLLPTGTYTADVTLVATDRAGNTKEASATVDIDTEVKPFTMTSDPTGADNFVNAAEAAAGINLAGTVEKGSTVKVTFDGKPYTADVDADGNWSLNIAAGDITPGDYDAKITIVAEDHVGNKAVIKETLAIDTMAPDGPIVNFIGDSRLDGYRSIAIETVMEGGKPTADVTSVAEVRADGSIVDVAGEQSVNIKRGETTFDFDKDVPNGSHLIVNSTDEAGNTSGTYLVLNDKAATENYDLSNAGFGKYQIENLDLDSAEDAVFVIDEASLVALSSGSNTLTIHGGSDDKLIIQNGAFKETQNVDGETYNVYTVGAEGMLLVDQDIDKISII